MCYWADVCLDAVAMTAVYMKLINTGLVVFMYLLFLVSEIIIIAMA